MLDPASAREFMESVHLKGFRPVQYHLGLVHKGDLLMVVSIGRPRYTNEADWELIRIGTKLVPGGLSKLLSFFRRNVISVQHTTFINYVDRRLFSGTSAHSLN